MTLSIKRMQPNKQRDVRRVNDRRVLNGIFWFLRSGAHRVNRIYRKTSSIKLYQ